MGADDKKLRGGRILRFAVSGALLVAPAAGLAACGGAETHSNEPAPVDTNEPAPEAHVNEPMEDEVNEPAPADDVHVNETDPGLDGE